MTLSVRALRRRAAFHEAGHVVARYVLLREVADVWISDDGSGSADTSTPGRVQWTRDRFEADIVIGLAGPVAEARSTRRSLAAVCLDGGAGDAARVQARLDELGSTNWIGFEEWARTLVRTHWDSVRTVADALLEAGRLAGRDVAELLEGTAPAAPIDAVSPPTVAEDLATPATPGPRVVIKYAETEDPAARERVVAALADLLSGRIK